MTNVVSISCTCDYLVKRAARHRRAGRFDEAMALLWKARNQFGNDEDVLIEMARIYEAIGSDEDAVRTYLRLVRLGGKHKAKALFQLTLFSAQHGDVLRAVSYFDVLRRLENPETSEPISSEMLEALARQLRHEVSAAFSFNPTRRAKTLEKHASACLQAGKAVAAQRAMEHSLRLRPTARGYTMLACCQLIRMRFEEAVGSAEIAHKLSAGNVQTLCVLSDAYLACGLIERAKRTMYLAALRAHREDDLLCVAVECAKAGEDALTLLLTGRLLKINPFHTRAMMIRACAYVNRHKIAHAKRLLGRLCGLVPENTICESYFKQLCAASTFSERLSLGLDVTREEGISRASELVSALYMDPQAIHEDQALELRICRLSDWAFRSPMAGTATKTAALILLSSMQSDAAKSVLLDLLTDPQISDTLKLHVLQVLTVKEGFYPYDVDLGGKLVRLAAGGISSRPVGADHANSQIVQHVADALSVHDCHASAILLEAFLAYLDAYGHPESRHEDACAAALEYWYLKQKGAKAQAKHIAARYGVSVRMLGVYLRRFESCTQEQE